ncbi:unnamed protein product, partial [Bubo scandiacus]
KPRCSQASAVLCTAQKWALLQEVSIQGRQRKHGEKQAPGGEVPSHMRQGTGDAPSLPCALHCDTFQIINLLHTARCTDLMLFPSVWSRGSHPAARWPWAKKFQLELAMVHLQDYSLVQVDPGVSIKAWGSHIKEDGLKENQEVFKIIPSTPKNIVLGQKSEVTAEMRESQT